MRPFIPSLVGLGLLACAETTVPVDDTTRAEGKSDSDRPSQEVVDGHSPPDDPSSSPTNTATPPTTAAPGPAPAADAPPANAPKTFITKVGSQIFGDDFSSASFNPNWTVMSGYWAQTNGKLNGTGSTDAYATPAVRHAGVSADRAIIAFKFSVHPYSVPHILVDYSANDVTKNQHLIGVSFDNSSVRLYQMKGWGNGPGSTTSSTLINKHAFTLSPDKDHVGVLEIFDRQVSFSMDGVQLVSGMTVDQSATPKNQLELGCGSCTVVYDEVTVFKALPL
jgi:hypothetical protein